MRGGREAKVTIAKVVFGGELSKWGNSGERKKGR